MRRRRRLPKGMISGKDEWASRFSRSMMMELTRAVSEDTDKTQAMTKRMERDEE